MIFLLLRHSKIIAGIVFCAIFALKLSAQPFTKKYLMAFHTCDVGCFSFQDHVVQVAESDNGADWTLVPNFPSYNGSVPDIIARNEQLYIFTPGRVRRYNRFTGLWDTSPVNISVLNSAGNPVSFVDPSAFIDDLGRIVLFFLNSSNIPIGQDPAGCSTYPCTKYFDSAIEIAGSNGTQFVLQSGHRAEIVLSSGTASDPDIFFDNTHYILYISRGGSTSAYQSPTLHGNYTSFATLPPNSLLTTQGGIPCGTFDAETNQYWTFVHSNVGGNTVIRRAVHTDFNNQLNTFSTVMSGPIMGQPTTTKTESPGICRNTFAENCTFVPIISGATQPCNNNTITYSVVAGIAGTIYNWSVSSNGTIISPLPYSNSITVLWGGSGIGNVSIEQIVP